MYYECIVYVLQYTCTMYSQQTVCRDNKNIQIKLLKLHTAVTIKHPVKQVTKYYGKKDNAKMSKKFIYSATYELNFSLLADISVRLTDRIQIQNSIILLGGVPQIHSGLNLKKQCNKACWFHVYLDGYNQCFYPLRQTVWLL